LPNRGIQNIVQHLQSYQQLALANTVIYANGLSAQLEEHADRNHQCNWTRGVDGQSQLISLSNKH